MRVADSFGGYALSQLKRIRTHRRWLLHRPEQEPTRADFGLPERSTLPRDQLGAARLDPDALPGGFLALLDRERRFRRARQEFEQYRSWLRHRNPARAALEARHGYDTKHAMHLVRLLRMAVEILETGQVQVRRPDRDELLGIRDGALSCDALIASTDTLSERIRTAKETSTLPAAPDDDSLEALCVSLVEEVLSC